MNQNAAYWINRLQLIEHAEGGYFRENYRSPILVLKENLPPGFAGDRPVLTSIYFLLKKDQFSAFHRIASDELWHFYAGDSLVIYELSKEGTIVGHRLGNNVDKGDSLQVVIKAGNWFAAKGESGGEYVLAGCSVAPGFDFADFELAERSELIRQYPEYKDLISALTK